MYRPDDWEPPPVCLSDIASITILSHGVWSRSPRKQVRARQIAFFGNLPLWLLGFGKYEMVSTTQYEVFSQIDLGSIFLSDSISHKRLQPNNVPCHSMLPGSNKGTVHDIVKTLEYKYLYASECRLPREQTPNLESKGDLVVLLCLDLTRTFTC